MFGSPVEFVPDGMTAEEARRARKTRRGPSGGDWVKLLVAVLCLVALIAAPVGYFAYKKNGEKLPVSTAVAVESSKKEHLPTATATHTPTLVQTVTATATSLSPFTATVQPIKAVFVSPIKLQTEQTQLKSVSTVTPTPTTSPTPTATATPGYEVIYQNTTPQESGSIHISGWIVEADGVTPRPVAVQLDYPTGSLQYPRPGAADVATGYYEFLVSPGDWVLRVKDNNGIAVPVHIPETTHPARYEISLKYTGVNASRVARSTPWDNQYPTPGASSVASSSDEPDETDQTYQVFLPVVVSGKTTVLTNTIYLPIVQNSR